MREKVQIKLGISKEWLEQHRGWRRKDCQEHKIDRVPQSTSPIGVMIDGSMDIARKDQQIVFARAVVNGAAQELFLGVRPARDGGADAIVQVLLLVVDDMLIDRKRILVLGTDGAGPMSGEHTGVGARVQRLQPFLLQNHCINHRYSVDI